MRRARQFTLHMFCINLQVAYFADNFRECSTLNAVYGEILKLNVLTELQHDYTLKGTRLKGKMRHSVFFF